MKAVNHPLRRSQGFVNALVAACFLLMMSVSPAEPSFEQTEGAEVMYRNIIIRPVSADSPLTDGAATAGGIDEAAMSKLGWKIAVQCYTYKDLTLFEALDNIQNLGVHYVELLDRQRISKDLPGSSGPGMDAPTMARLREKLAQTGIQPVAVWVDPFPRDEAGLRRLFGWAKQLGIDTVTTEPCPADTAALALADRLCQEYHIRIAIHNHGKPSTYWNPDDALRVVSKYSTRIGLCPDTGHWFRSGLPVVESLKKAEGRIVSLHLKDIAENHRDAPYGKGINDVAGQLAELKRQGFQGVLTIEYENWGDRQHADLVNSVDFLNQQAALLLEP